MSAKYEIVKKEIISRIKNNEFSLGTKLPNSSSLCRMLGVSDITLRRGLLDLSNEGYVERINGKGTFVVDRAAKHKKNDSTNSISLIIPDIGKSNFYSNIALGVSEATFEHDYNLVLCNSMEDPKLEEAYLKRKSPVNGTILVSINSDAKFYNTLKKVSFDKPLVIVDIAVENMNADYITTNDYEAICEAVDYLVRQGRKNICLLHKDSTPSSTMFNRKKGYQEAILRNNLEENILEFEADEYKKAYNKVLGNFCGRNRPDAVIATTEWLAREAYKAAIDSKLKIPKDITLLNFGSTIKDEFRNIEFSGIIQPAREMGRKAVEIISGKIEGRSSSSTFKEIVMQSKLTIKGT